MVVIRSVDGARHKGPRRLDDSPTHRTMRRLLPTLLGLLATVIPSVVSAQLCVGQPSLTTTRGNLGIGFMAGDDVTSYAAGGTAAVTPAFFASLNAGVHNYEDLDGSTFVLSPSVGVDLTGGKSTSASICAVVGAGLGFGPNNIEGSGIDASTRDLSGGLAVGGMIGGSGSVKFIPTATGAIAHSTVKLSYDGESASVSDTYGLLVLGVGIVADDVITIQPSIAVPIGAEDGTDPRFGVSLSYAFRR